MKDLKEISAEAAGRVKTIHRKESGTDVILEVSELKTAETEQIPCSGLLIHIYDPVPVKQAADLEEGNTVRFSGMLSNFPAVRNDGVFDSGRYYRSVGVQYMMAAEKITGIQNSPNITRLLRQFRDRLSKVFDQIAPETDASVLKAVVLGDQSSLEEDLKQLYRRNGIAHLLAISGLHVSVIGLLVYRFLRKCGAGYGLSFAAGTVLLLSYGVMTGNGVSVRRAVLMCILSMGAETAGRSYDLLSALSLSMILIVKDNLWVIDHAGFQLSFGAVLGIAVLAPVLHETVLSGLEARLRLLDPKRQAVRRYLLQSGTAVLKGLLGSIAISLMTLPVLLYHYFEVPVYSPFLNLIVIPLMSVLILCALAAGGAGLFFLPAGTFFVGTVHGILQIYHFLCGLFESLPGSRLVTGRPDLWRCLLYYFLLAAFVFAAGKKKRRKRLKIGLLPATAVLLLLFARPENRLVIDMIDVGQGDCILVRAPNGDAYMFDGGSSDIKNVGSRCIYPVLRSKGITAVRYVFVSHSDEDHINGISELLDSMDQTFRIENLVFPGITNAEGDENYLRLREKAAQRGVSVLYVNEGSRIRFMQRGIALEFRCLHPGTGYAYDSANDYSAVYLLQYADFSMLLTGDLEEKGENELLKKNLAQPVSVLKTAHHGSKSSTSESWLSKVRPQIAVISCGVKNRYGHPAQQTLERLKNSKTLVYVTAQCGQIRLQTDGKHFNIRTKLQDKTA